MKAESVRESSAGPSVRRLRCYRGPLRPPALLLGVAPVLLVVTPSGHEYHSHLHLSGDNTPAEIQAIGELPDQAVLAACRLVATIIRLVLAERVCSWKKER